MDLVSDSDDESPPEHDESRAEPPLNKLPQAPPPKKLSKAERKALEEKRKREAAAAAAKRAPKIEPKLGKFVADKAQIDEKARIVALHKDCAERGKVPANMLPMLIKDLFKPIEKEFKKEFKKLSTLATEVFAEKGAKGLEAGDMTTWYFDVAWPMIDEARRDAKAAAQQAAAAAAAAAAEAEAARKAAEAEAAALARLAELEAKEAARVKAAEEAKAAAAAAAAREAEEEARRQEEAEKVRREEEAKAQKKQLPGRRGQVPDHQQPTQPPQPQPPLPQQPQQKEAHPPPKGTAPTSAPAAPPAAPFVRPSGLRIEPNSARASAQYDAEELPEEPVGWAAARLVNLAEHRRVLGFLMVRVLPPDDAAPTEMLVLAAMVRTALGEALLPLKDNALLNEAPKARKGSAGVPIGRVVQFWFERVWPKHGMALTRALQNNSAMSAMSAEEQAAAEEETGEAPADSAAASERPDSS
jgi:hypothetical protein